MSPNVRKELIFLLMFRFSVNFSLDGPYGSLGLAVYLLVGYLGVINEYSTKLRRGQGVAATESWAGKSPACGEAKAGFEKKNAETHVPAFS